VSVASVLHELSCELAPELHRMAELEARRGLVRSDLLGIGCLTPSLAQAQAELVAVHMAECSSVLSAAARLALRGVDAPAQELGAVRARAGEVRRMLALDGLVPVAALAHPLASLAQERRAQWPRALELASLAVALRPSAHSRAALALALAARGEWRSASAIALAALSRPRSAAVRRRWLARLCRWLERLGDHERAALLRAA
jgi:hypothetical protein